jgi:hypothetical protein
VAAAFKLAYMVPDYFTNLYASRHSLHIFIQLPVNLLYVMQLGVALVCQQFELSPLPPCYFD